MNEVDLGEPSDWTFSGVQLFFWVGLEIGEKKKCSSVLNMTVRYIKTSQDTSFLG